MSATSGHKSNQVLALDTPLSYDPDNEMIWGDESSNKELIYLRADGTSVRRQSLVTGQITRFNTSLGDARIRIAKFAPETHLLCLQRNDKEVEFLDLRSSVVSSNDGESSPSSPVKRDTPSPSPNGTSGTGTVNGNVSQTSTTDSASKRQFRFVQACSTNTKIENKLLGFFWVSPTMLVLVSKIMIELFAFNSKILSDSSSSMATSNSRASFTPHGPASNAQPAQPLTKLREIAVAVNWWTYSAVARVLIISTDPIGNKIAPFHFHIGNMDLIPLPKFKIDMKNCEKVGKADVYLRQIYQQVYCIFMNNTTNELVFYHLMSDQVTTYLTISNVISGPLRLSFVDNIILAHSTSLKVTAIYDIRFRSKNATIIDSPITPPLQIARPLDIGLPSNTATQYSPNNGSSLSPASYSPRNNGDSAFGEAENGTQSENSSPYSLQSSHSAISISSPSSTSTPASPISSPISISSVMLPSYINGIPPSPTASPSIIATSPSSSSLTALSSSSMTMLPGAKSPKIHPSKIDFSRHFSYDYVQFLVPEYAVNRHNGQIYKLALNLDGFVAAFRDPVRLAQFLMRRDRSKPVLLKLMRKLIEQRQDMRIIADILDRFSAALQNHTDEQKMAVQQAAALKATIQRPSSSSPSRIPEGRNGSPSPTISSSPLGVSSASSSSSSKRSSLSDPWSMKRADQYVMAFRRGANRDQTKSPEMSTPSPSNMSPVMSPSSSLGTLPTPEELGLVLVTDAEPTLKTRRGIVVISQQDMYTQVFLPLEEKNLHWKTLLCVLLTYVTSLTQHAQLTVDSDIYGFIVDLLVRNKQYYQLHQLLQLKVISDTLHVACQLMHLADTYPPAVQLALDMFRRLKEHAYTIESLLTRGMVLIGLRFLKTISWTPLEAQSLVPRFLQEARNSGDATLFYVTYQFFLQRREIFTGICDEHSKYFHSEFAQPPSTPLPTL